MYTCIFVQDPCPSYLGYYSSVTEWIVLSSRNRAYTGPGDRVFIACQFRLIAISDEYGPISASELLALTAAFLFRNDINISIFPSLDLSNFIPLSAATTESPTFPNVLVFVHSRAKGCLQCLLIIKRHRNIIQYKESKYIRHFFAFMRWPLFLPYQALTTTVADKSLTYYATRASCAIYMSPTLTSQWQPLLSPFESGWNACPLLLKLAWGASSSASLRGQRGTPRSVIASRDEPIVRTSVAEAGRGSRLDKERRNRRQRARCQFNQLEWHFAWAQWQNVTQESRELRVRNPYCQLGTSRSILTKGQKRKAQTSLRRSNLFSFFFFLSFCKSSRYEYVS